MPVTRAPSLASASARIPPPQPTSSTRLPPNPLNTARKYSTRTAFSSCSPANGPASLHHTPGIRSTRRSYFSGSGRPPRRGGEWGSDMRQKSTGLWRRWDNPPPPPFTALPRLHRLPSGRRFHIRERRHVEEPEPRQSRALVDFDQQAVRHAHHGGGTLAPHPDVQHRFRLVFLDRERRVPLDGRDRRLRLARGKHDARVLRRRRGRELLVGADVVRPGDHVHATQEIGRAHV